MGEQGHERELECAHCGRAFVVRGGPGRPARYCRRSCRQRAFEQRRHVGDQAWSDARLIVQAQHLAEHEDALDRVRALVEQLRSDLGDEVEVDLVELADQLEVALELFVDP